MPLLRLTWASSPLRQRVSLGRGARNLSGRAGVGSHRVVGQLGVVASPDEQLPGAVALPIVLERGREPLGEQAAGGVELVLARAPGERRLDHVGRDATADE